MISNPQPHSREVEQTVLSCLIRKPNDRGRGKKALSKDDFYDSRHQYLFDEIIEGNADLVGIKTNLEMKGLLEKAGGQQYLMDLAVKSSTTAELETYIAKVAELSNRRKLICLAQGLIDNASKASSEDLAKDLRKGIQDIELRDQFGFRSGVAIENVYTPERCLKEYASHIENLKRNRFRTGIPEIDKRIRGVAAGETLFFQARTASFKTALLQNLLINYIQHSSWGAVFFSIEMPIPSVTERYHEIIQGSTGRDIEAHYSQEGALPFKAQLEKDFIKKLKGLYIVPTRVSISDIAAYTKLIEKEYKTKIGVIGIDYLGLMEGPGQGEYEIVSRLARGTKNMAKRLNIPVIVIAQTSRRAGSGDVEISLDMGRGSGAVEEAADFVLGLWQVERERSMMEDSEPEYDLICRILKNRKGPKGSRWKLDLDPTNLRIGPDAESWEPPKKTRAKSYDG